MFVSRKTLRNLLERIMALEKQVADLQQESGEKDKKKNRTMFSGARR